MQRFAMGRALALALGVAACGGAPPPEQQHSVVTASEPSSEGGDVAATEPQPAPAPSDATEVAAPPPSAAPPSAPSPIAIDHAPFESACTSLRHTFDEENDYAPRFPRARSARALAALLDAEAERAVTSFRGRCGMVLVADESLVSLACVAGGGDDDEALHVTEVLTVALGEEPRRVSVPAQFVPTLDLASLAVAACLGQIDAEGSDAVENCGAIGEDLAGYQLALGPRGVLVVNEVDGETMLPFAGASFEIPYGVVAESVAPGSALAGYLAHCPAALAP
jgi:hypothetical protein